MPKGNKKMRRKNEAEAEKEKGKKQKERKKREIEKYFYLDGFSGSSPEMAFCTMSAARCAFWCAICFGLDSSLAKTNF
jgi:hypothetical protein